MKTLLVLEANSISYLVVRQLVSLLEGYRRTDSELQNGYVEITPVIVYESGNSMIDRIVSVLKEYSMVATVMQAHRYCEAFISAPLKCELKDCSDEEQNEATRFLLSNNTSLKQAYCYVKSLQSLKSLGHDKVVTFVSVANNNDNLPLAEASLSLFKNPDNCIVCQCGGDISNRVRELSDLADKHIALTGCLENAHLYRGFASMQSACMLFKALTDRLALPTIAGSNKDPRALNYTNDNLFYAQGASAIFRVAAISLFMEGLEDGDLKALQKRIGLTDPIWNSSETRKAFEKISDNYNRWRAEAKGYDPAFSPEAENMIVKRLNSISKLRGTATTDAKIDELIRCLRQTECVQMLHEDIPDLSTEILDINIKEFQDWRKELSPTALYEFGESAFDHADAPGMKRIRTAILDCWENYYRKYPDNKLKRQSVRELEGLLSLTQVGKGVVEGEWVYSDTLASGIKWITSPATGFAVCIDNSYLPTMELKDRSEDFQKFMLCYISLFEGQFSENFRNYVKTNTQGVMDMTTLSSASLFKIFEQFRNCKLDISK